ncbi:MAG: hypothetical protein J6M60_00395 [Clostridia bacterium]|nr:hypothetical protein [Clostridia bacterium]
MKTFNYESKCVKYNDCFFDRGEYDNGNLELSIYGRIENDINTSHISNPTINVKEKLKGTEIVIDTEVNTNLISFLMDLGIAKGIKRRIVSNGMQFPVVELDLSKLDEYSYEQEVLRYAS